MPAIWCIRPGYPLSWPITPSIRVERETTLHEMRATLLGMAARGSQRHHGHAHVSAVGQPGDRVHEFATPSGRVWRCRTRCPGAAGERPRRGDKDGRLPVEDGVIVDSDG